MEWRDLVGNQPKDIRKALEREGMKGRYATIVLSLATAETDVLKEIDGDYIGVASITGDGTCKVRLDHRHAQELNLRQVSEIASPFGKMYFTTDGAGGEVVLLIGGALTARIKPIQSKVSLRSTAGTDVDPVQDKRFMAHTFKSLKPTTQTTTNVRQPLIASSTKARWALIHFLSKVALIGTSTVTRGGGADDGQKYPDDAYLTLEHIDLSEINIINYALGEQCIYTINYILEEA